MKYILSLLILVFTITAVTAQEPDPGPSNSSGTAYLMPAHTWECGINQPYRHRLSPKIELFTYAFKFPLSPNAGIKVGLGQKGNFLLASEHALNFPTPLLNVISREGIGGVLSPEFDFPFILTVTNNLLATSQLSSNQWLTLKAGWIVALRGSVPDRQSTIDLPVFYPRMAHYYKGTSIRVSAGLKGRITKKLWYDEGIQLFCITRSYNNLFIENTGSLSWSVCRRISLKGGYNLSYGHYPFGSHWQLWPAFDLIFGSKR